MEIEHACGHTQDRDLSNVPTEQRRNKAWGWSQQPCTECFKKASSRKLSREFQQKVASERAAEREAALADQARSGLPLLRGSDKQQAWALTVRFNMLKGAYEEFVAAGRMTETEFEESVLEPARRIDLASWWIDQRKTSAEALPTHLSSPGLAEDEFANENPF